jgi:hypothetical protein
MRLQAIKTPARHQSRTGRRLAPNGGVLARLRTDAAGQFQAFGNACC